MTDRHNPFEPSSALLAAQARLEKLKEEVRVSRSDPDSSDAVRTRQAPGVGALGSRNTAVELGQQLLEKRRRQEAIAQGARASDALQAYRKPEFSRPKWSPPPHIKAKEQPENDKQDIRGSSPIKEKTVKVYPSLALAMLQTEFAAPGRVYWLLKNLDSQGRGWLTIEEVRLQLTNKKSSFRVCGWRRLRQILTAGEDLFWARDRVGRLWIKGPARVAQALGCDRLKGKPISLPLTALLGGIKQVRAHFYASYHSGRREASPITRSVLRGLAGVPERTQRQYERVAKIASKRNIAIGERYSKEAIEERAWRQGQAAFRFLDTNGKQGAPGREYVAWHMPNSYTGPHSQRCKGRQKKINRQLRELVMKGMRANGRETVEKLFWQHGAAAGKAFNKNPAADAYWQSGQARAKHFILWGVIAGKRC